MSDRQSPSERRTLSVTTDSGTKQFTVVSIEIRSYGDWITVTDGEPLIQGSYEATLHDGNTSTRGVWSIVVGRMNPKTFRVVMEGWFQPTAWRLTAE